MPAPLVDVNVNDSNLRQLNHVNLMVDTFIQNADADDLRATVRALLATTAPSTAVAFTKAARARLAKTHPAHIAPDSQLFAPDPSHFGLVIPGPDIAAALRHARALYGSGLGLAGLEILLEIVQATGGLRWTESGPTGDLLAVVDADCCQAIQSAKEEIGGGRAGQSFDRVRATIAHARAVLGQSAKDVSTWSPDFPFERAFSSLEVWKV
ncbi:hypothetical protein PENSPDRAFT_652391 [Peniophora sp. CONT]|nr:hypothetical protein PENSPDRAFT_652391 [Peniophora sp. CONT]